MSFGIFLYGNVLFVLTLLAIALPLCKHFQRKSKFRRRVALAALFALPVIAVSYLYYCSTRIFVPGGAAFALVSVFNYLLLFAAVVAILVLLYDESFWQLLLCAVSAYAAQHIMSNIIGFVRAIFGLDTLLTGSTGQILLFFAIQLLVSVLDYIVLYFTFIRVVNRDYAAGGYTKEVLYTSVMTLLAVLVLNFFRDLYGAESAAMNAVCGVFSILSCSFILLIYTSILHQNRLRAEYETVTELWNKDKKQYALAKDSIEMINIKCHDLRKRFDLFEEQGFADQAEIEAMRDAINIYDAALKTGNPALDTLLMEYLISCEKHNILFTCTVDGERLGFMQAEDIYSLFSNLISNAMEAVQKLDDPEKRVISLVVREQSGMLAVRMENYYAGNLAVENGALQTSKRDKESHGFGVKSMRILVEKYGGVLDFDAQDDIFAASILFPITD